MSKIKERLKDAYDKVTFYADRTWVNEPSSFQRANQELYARETKLQDLLMEETKRPRTVQDCIPNSKLARYSNYEYNESRELSYAANIANISFYYPCTFKRDSIKEPWMLPEIEQLFIWLTYSCDFNLLDPIALEELDHLDEQENTECGSAQSCCCCDDDFHQINPFFYKTMERAPGKPRYTTAPLLINDEDILPSTCSLMKISSFEDMILRIKLKSEKVQNCWARSSVPMKRRVHGNPATASEKGFNIFKSPFGNFFIFEDARNIRNIPNLETIEVLADEAVSENVHEIGDFSNLQELTNSFSSLQAWVLSASAKNIPVSAAVKSDKNEGDKNESQPAKRLYSAVLQGLASNNKISSLKSEQTTSSSGYTNPAMAQENCKQQQNVSPKTVFNESTSAGNKPGSQKVASSAGDLWQSQYAWESLTGTYNSNSSKKGSYASAEQTVKPSTPTATQNHVLTARPQSPTSADCWSKQINPGVSCNGPYTSCPSTMYSSNVSFSSNSFNSNPYAGGFSGNLAATNNYPFNFCPNNYANTSYPNAISYSYSNNIYPNNQISSGGRNTPPLSRQAFAPPPIHLNPPPSILLIQQHRAATIYPFSHYAPAPHYLCLPTPPASRPSQRWQSSYIRPPSASSQSYHVPLTPPPPSPQPQQPQHWGLPSQHLYRTNSNQYLATASQPIIYDNFDVSMNKLKTNNNRSKKSTAPQSGTTAQYNKTKSRPTLECCTKDTDFNDVLFDSYLKKAANKNCKCPSDVGVSLQQQNEKTVLLKSSTSNSSLEYNRFNRQASLSKLIFSKNGKQATSESHTTLEGGCDLDHRLPLTSSLSEDLERQALEQYQPSNENFYQELERQAAEQCSDFPENWTRPPNSNVFFGGLGLRKRLFCCLFLLVLYVDVRVCGCCLFALY